MQWRIRLASGNKLPFTVYAQKHAGTYLGVALVLLAAWGSVPGLLPASAQQPPQSAPVQQPSSGTPAPAAASATMPAPVNLPTLLLVPLHTTSVPARRQVGRDDMNLTLLDTLRDALHDSGRFEVLTYSPTQPRIKRALLEHVVSAAELVEPVSPAVLQRLARALGARYILAFGASFDKTGMNTDVRFQEIAGTQDWRTLVAEQILTDISHGKTEVIGVKNGAVHTRRSAVKPKEMIDIAVDAIMVRMGIPSHLADNIHLGQAVPIASAKVDKEGKKPTPAQATAEPAPGGFVPIADASTQSKAVRAPGAAGGAQAGTRAPSPPATGDKQGQGTRRTANANGGVSKENERPSTAFTTDTAPGRVEQPTTPSVAPAAAEPNNEALVTYFRQAGDLANVITSLRHAINERPRDIALRSQLIQAYQERNLLDAALAEAGRAMQIAPKESRLQRLYGDTLLAKGDVAGAMKAYREATHLDPTDITAQVALGDALLADNQYTEALSAYQAAAKNDPKSPLPHRRLARALAGRASADPTQYAASLAQIQQARTLTPPTDTETYLGDYTALMHLMASRLRDIQDELQNTYLAVRQGKTTGNEPVRAAADMKERAQAVAEYLDKLPPAAGQDVTHAHYQQGAALLLQALGLFRDFLSNNDPHTEEAMKGAQKDALSEFNTATRRLDALHSTAGSGLPADTGGADLP